ncbi:MAG: hypothetical protein AAB421_04220 [Patescibacteria group bacterium]
MNEQMPQRQLGEGDSSGWHKAKKVLKWVLIVAAVLYGIGVLMMIYKWYVAPEAVERIHARKVTMDMVMGKNLPPVPDVKKNNKTVAGIDANNNGVRDDVELEIWRRHPQSARIRAAQLQYAQALQSQITEVIESTTLVAALQEVDRGSGCIWDAFPEDKTGQPNDKPLHEWNQEEIDLGNSASKKARALREPVLKEIDALVLNTPDRTSAKQQTYKFMVGYGDGIKMSDCDVLLDSLPN